MNLQGKGHYKKNKVEEEYTVVAFTKNPDGAYSSWDKLIEAQKQVSDQVITENTDLYVNWAEKILTADVTAELPAGGTTAGTARRPRLK